jgi:hypothetical protein
MKLYAFHLFISLLIGGQLSAAIDLDTTIIVNNVTFKVQTSEIRSQQKSTLTISNSTRIILSDTLASVGLSTPALIDFNTDGNLDIKLRRISEDGQSYLYYLYIFDSKNNTFVLIEDFDKIERATQIKNSHNYYYSFPSSNIGDIWISKLYYIKDFKLIYAGEMIGNVGSFNTSKNPPVFPQTIDLFKISNDTHENKENVLSFKEDIQRLEDIETLIAFYWPIFLNKYKDE